MKKIFKIATLALMMPAMATFVSCDDAFEPAIENIKDGVEDFVMYPSWVEAYIAHAYISNPLDELSFNDMATDDAVSNEPGNTYRSMATGSWSASNNPMDRWRDLRGSIVYLNSALELIPQSPWASIPSTQEMFVARFSGEVYGLRALFMLHLLRNHAGMSNGQLLGVPIVLEPETPESNFNLPRNTFADCYKQLIEDANMAIELLTEEAFDLKDNEAHLIPAKWAAKGVEVGEYNRVWGAHTVNRMNARVAKAIKAQAALLAASPAFEASGVTWAEAADAAADVLAALGTNPIAGMDPKGHIWYAQNSDISKLTGGNQAEILWRGNKGENSDREKSSYPPGASHNGNGRVNPTQNFVDAFPMANGLPITDPNSGYDPANPYAGRDPRLNNYVVLNGSNVAGKAVDTSVDNPTNIAGLNQDPNYRATRTGYYLRKHMNENVSIQTDGSANNAWHFTAFIRYTEMFLAYAEAANEAWGPKGTGTHGYSAYDVIKAIRARAGITGVQGSDAYLEECAADQAKMRELIRNERRIELSFEGHRFWDMRRWNLKLDEDAKGVRISNGTYEYIVVDPRRYSSFQVYGPIPYTEVIKFSELAQNDGWK